MKLTAIIAPTVVTILAISVASAHAQQRERGNNNRPAAQENRGRAIERGRAVERGQSAQRGQPVQRSESVERGQPIQRSQSVQGGQSIPRGQFTERGGAPSGPQNRAYGQFRDAPRGEAVPRSGSDRFYERPRYEGPRYEGPRAVIVEPRRPYGYRSYAYPFRPRVRVGFGVFLGYPVPYPYYDPYAYPARIYGYGYPATGPSPQTGYGGVSLEITPADANVFVDGVSAGVVGDFYDPSRPLSVTAGRHRIQVEAPGYAPLVFDVVVLPGQVIPYRGDLQP